MPRTPRFTLPPHSCDCHAHICGPRSRYEYFPRRVYTPPDCLLPAYQAMLQKLGLERAVLVQPSVYGSDNSAMLDALAAGGTNLRGVAVVDDTISDEELDRLHAAGVRGVRCNIVDVQPEDKGKLPFAQLQALAARIQRLNWHIELLMHVDEFPDLDTAFARFPVDLVFGHLGYMRTDKGMQAPGFQALLRLMRGGRSWVKLTGPYRISPGTLPYADVTAFAHELISAAKDRVVWGSDWPHVMTRGAMPNDADLCNLLLDWIPDQATRAQVLVHNPARLYGFS